MNYVRERGDPTLHIRSRAGVQMPLHDGIDQPVGLILAGGRAMRMGGGDKVLLPLGPVTVLDHVIARIAPQVGSLALSANGDGARFARFALPVLPDLEPGLGPLSGIVAGLAWAVGNKVAWLLSVSGDTPFLPLDLVARLAATAREAKTSAVYARDDNGAHPACALWHVSLKPVLEAALKARHLKLRTALESVGAARADFPGTRAFHNINTAEDLRLAASYMPSA